MLNWPWSRKGKRDDLGGSAFGWGRFPDHRPDRCGRYEVYRTRCNKQHYLTWNGVGWSSDHDTVTHFREIITPNGDILL